jgi:hypothetical protein
MPRHQPIRFTGLLEQRRTEWRYRRAQQLLRNIQEPLIHGERSHGGILHKMPHSCPPALDIRKRADKMVAFHVGQDVRNDQVSRREIGE